MKINVGTGWDSHSLETSRQVVQMVADTVEELVGTELGSEVFVINIRDADCPIAHFEKLAGAFVVTLSCAADHNWSQIAYQLAHELCHLYSNHSSSFGHKHKWFEEALCEAASIATLYQLGKRWHESSLAAVSPGYGRAISSYIKSRHHRTRLIKFKADFKGWLGRNLVELEASSTQRHLNDVVAQYLYTRLLAGRPEAWRAIRYLNLWDCHANVSFADFGRCWLEATPAEDKHHTLRFLELLTIAKT